MFVLENLIFALAKIMDIGLTIYMWIIIGRAVSIIASLAALHRLARKPK